jgi:hypothetical protein
LLGLSDLSRISISYSRPGSNGTSAMMARSTPARNDASRQVSPELRPKSSTTRKRSCEPALVRRSLMNMTERVTAVENPRQ